MYKSHSCGSLPSLGYERACETPDNSEAECNYDRQSFGGDYFPDHKSFASGKDNSHQEGPGSIFSSVFNLVSSCGGGGVLSLPFAFKETGLILGCLILVFVASISAYSAHLLVACSRRTKARIL